MRSAIPKIVRDTKELLLWLKPFLELEEGQNFREPLLFSHLKYQENNGLKVEVLDAYGSHTTIFSDIHKVSVLNIYGDEDRFTDDEQQDMGICLLINDKAYVFDLLKPEYYVSIEEIDTDHSIYAGKRTFYFWKDSLELSLRVPHIKYGIPEEKSKTWVSGPRVSFKMEKIGD
jgi:hypothetical protein